MQAMYLAIYYEDEGRIWEYQVDKFDDVCVWLSGIRYSRKGHNRQFCDTVTEAREFLKMRATQDLREAEQRVEAFHKLIQQLEVAPVVKARQ